MHRGPTSSTVSVNPWAQVALTYLRQRRQRQSLAFDSRQQYLYRLAALADGLAHLPLGAPAEVVANAVYRLMDQRRWAPSTRSTFLGTVRPFFAWAAAHIPAVADDISRQLRNPRKPDPLPRAQPVDAVAALLAGVPDARGRAIVLLMANCGLRRAEVARLNLRDVDLIDGRILVHGKGGKQRVAYASPETVEALRLWVAQRGGQPGALICHLDHPGRALSPTWVGTLVGRWMADAGLKTMPHDGVSGHALRHTAATQLLRGGANVRVVQAAMGHASLVTTARYLRADDPEVRAAMASLSFGTRRLRAVGGDDG